MKLQVLDTSPITNTRPAAWLLRMAKTQELFTSQLPKTLEKIPEHENVLLQSLLFNKPLSQQQYSQLFRSVSISASQEMIILDFGRQLWTQSELGVLLQWLSKSCQVIDTIKLGEAQFTMDAWKILFDWLISGGVSVECVDLGCARMSLPRVRCLHALCKSEHAGLQKLDFGESVWAMQHLKALLWDLFGPTTAITRISLSAAKIPSEGVDLLAYYIHLSHSSIKVFSSGIIALSDKALGYIIDKARQENGSLEACILSEQVFRGANAEGLASLVSTNSNLKHLALLGCEWQAEHVMPSTNEKKSIQRVFLEGTHGGETCETLLHVFQSWGFSISRRSGNDSYWLMPREE